MSTAVVSIPIGVRKRNGDLQKATTSGALVGRPPQPVVWNPQDEAVIRFAAPASRNHEQQLATHMAAARAAYAKAFLLIRKTSKEVSLADPEVGGEKALIDTATEILSTSPAKSHVSDFVNSLHHFHGVFDVLCQADFSYLSMMKSRGDLLVSITDMLIEIGLDLSRVEVCTKMFPTNRMLELTSMLYAAVVDFLKEVIEHFQQNKMRKLWSSMTQPFEQRFGYVKARIQTLERHIQKDFTILQAMYGMAQQAVDPNLQRTLFERTLSNSASSATSETLFLQIKETLFKGFAHEAHYHEELAATYQVTSGAWEMWFSEEQRHLPSVMRSASKFNQGFCDAPDSQHALQWVAQQRALSPHIPSAYLIWAKGMTVKSAIASLLFQIINQRRAVLSQHNIDIPAFQRANAGVKPLWDMFVHLMRVLGGCLIYISMGSVGPDEFLVVEKFAKAVKNWDGPPISVTIIHPLNDGFVQVEDATDLDGLYDVCPSLTTTDALFHVISLELGGQLDVSDTIRGVLWDTAWREIRYATIGISLSQVLEVIKQEALRLGLERVEDEKMTRNEMQSWTKGIQKWVEGHLDFSYNSVREQIQRYLEVVELGLPAEVKARLAHYLQRCVFAADMDQLGSRALNQPQRHRVFAGIQTAINPAAVTTFCGAVDELVEEALDDYCEMVKKNPRKGVLAVLRALDELFGWDGRWRETYMEDKNLFVEGIAQGMEAGFRDVITALLETDEGGI
ncbi:hypothetical protein HJFPF1_08759 [Paramyrothecium foliicola]|nr:hypothetical protein HJFPF1_08759 [Paramyrothecium foliicola]